MKVLSIISIVLILTSVSKPQQFTKVTEGTPVNDGGDSRSVNWIDYNGDGYLDLFVSNGPSGGQNNFLYKNNGDGTFEKISGLAITSDGRSSDGSSWGDFDNDGDPDLFVANWYNQNNLFYSNNGDGTFTLNSGSVIASDGGYSESGTWGDYNNDGLLDLYVCNSEGNKRNFLYKNNGNGSFEKIITGPQSTDAFYSRNADWIDYNNDGFDDLFVTNEANQNENLYENNNGESFTSLQIPSLLNFNGKSTSSSWADINNDGYFDLFVANYDNQNNFLFINNGDGTFTKVTNDPVVTDNANSFGSCFGDVDNDGDLDLFVTNAFTGSKTINYFYLNNGDGTFTKDEEFSSDSGWAYGCAFGDYNKDGYLDLFVAKCFGAVENNALYKNNGGNNNWLLLDLEGIKSNRSAIGAVVKIKADIFGNSVWQMRRVAGQTGYCGQNLQLHFGLGDAVSVDSMIIDWPSGIKQILTHLNTNTDMKITEDTTLITSTKTGQLLPKKFMLYQNYPNPFNPVTNILFTISDNQFVTLNVYDVLGNKVSSLVNEEKQAGIYSVIFPGNNIANSVSSGSELASSVYFYQLKAGNYTETKKMVFMK